MNVKIYARSFLGERVTDIFLPTVEYLGHYYHLLTDYSPEMRTNYYNFTGGVIKIINLNGTVSRIQPINPERLHVMVRNFYDKHSGSFVISETPRHGLQFENTSGTIGSATDNQAEMVPIDLYNEVSQANAKLSTSSDEERCITYVLTSRQLKDAYSGICLHHVGITVVIDQGNYEERNKCAEAFPDNSTGTAIRCSGSRIVISCNSGFSESLFAVHAGQIIDVKSTVSHGGTDTVSLYRTTAAGHESLVETRELSDVITNGMSDYRIFLYRIQAEAYVNNSVSNEELEIKIKGIMQEMDDDRIKNDIAVGKLEEEIKKQLDLVEKQKEEVIKQKRATETAQDSLRIEKSKNSTNTITKVATIIAACGSIIATGYAIYNKLSN